MKKIFLLALCAVGCGEGLAPSPYPTSQCVITVNGGTAACGNVSITQAPSPTPGATPGVQDCRVDYLTGNGPDYIPMGGEVEFDLTPMQTFVDAQGAQQTREVSAACNEPKAASIEWLAGDPRALQVIGLGFKAKVKRIGTGTTTVSVSFEGRTKVWSVQ